MSAQDWQHIGTYSTVRTLAFFQTCWVMERSDVCVCVCMRHTLTSNIWSELGIYTDVSWNVRTDSTNVKGHHSHICSLLDKWPKIHNTKKSSHTCWDTWSYVCNLNMLQRTLCQMCWHTGTYLSANSVHTSKTCDSKLSHISFQPIFFHCLSIDRSIHWQTPRCDMLPLERAVFTVSLWCHTCNYVYIYVYIIVNI